MTLILMLIAKRAQRVFFNPLWPRTILPCICSWHRTVPHSYFDISLRVSILVLSRELMQAALQSKGWGTRSLASMRFSLYFGSVVLRSQPSEIERLRADGTCSFFERTHSRIFWNEKAEALPLETLCNKLQVIFRLVYQNKMLALKRSSNILMCVWFCNGNVLLAGVSELNLVKMFLPGYWKSNAF